MTIKPVVIRKGRVNLSDLTYDTKLYPREKWRASTIETYADVVRQGVAFPPLVLLEKTNTILDGVHRWKAYQLYAEQYEEHQRQPGFLQEEGEQSDGADVWREPPESLDVEWHTLPDGIPPKLYSAYLSSTHGDRITQKERETLARELYAEHPDFSLELLASLLSVSKSTAGNYVGDILARRTEERNVLAYRLHLLGWTQEDIGAVCEVTQKTVSTILVKFRTLEKGIKTLLDSRLPHLDVAGRHNMPLILIWACDLSGRDDEERMNRLKITIQPYDVWNFSECHALFGNEHPGRIPGQLIAHTLYFFTQPGAIVVDPMAGSGTTLDVCLAMGRGCYGYDIDLHHDRPDILQHDIYKDGWPETIRKAGLIFWDPPYFSKKDNEYVEGSISSLSREHYLAFFATRFKEAYAMVKKGTRLAFLMSDWDDNTGKRDGIFLWDYAQALQHAGWTLLRHIQTPLSTQQVHPDIVKRFRKEKRLARLERYLLIAEKRA